MRDIEIYVEGKRLDLFDNGTIEIKSSIQDAKDISKVFTDYSQPFTIPASDNNNQIFRHHYKTEITDNVFDGRVRHEAKIFINHLLFKRGKVFLNGTSMKNSKASSYNITFFGNTVSLKDTFKDDKIESLSDYKKGIDGTAAEYNLNRLEFDWSNDSIRTRMLGGQSFNNDTSALIVPLITAEKRLFYNDSLDETNSINFDGNLHRPNDISANLTQYRTRGVNEEDLKPAIKVYHLIKAIEEKYNINFIPSDADEVNYTDTKDFFSRDNQAFTNLYLWMSNNSGNITGNLADDNYLYVNEVASWTSGGNQDFNNYYAEGGEIVLVNWNEIERDFGHTGGFVDSSLFPTPARFYLKVIPDSSYEEIKWRAKIIDTKTSQVVSSIEGTGSVEANISMPLNPTDPSITYIDRYKVEFASQEPMVGTDVQIIKENASGLTGFSDVREILSSGDDFDTDITKFKPANHFPDIEIMEFMSGLFKMFNLTAYYVDDEADPLYNDVTPVVKIVTLDSYYADSVNNQSKGIIDITKHIDVSNNSIDTSLPFSEINFEFEETDTILMDNHKEVNGYVYGNSTMSLRDTYRNIDLFYGEKYDIEIPFSKLKYERINGLDTDIVWGYAAGGDFDSKEGDYEEGNTIPPKANYKPKDIKPLLFYGIKETNISTPINFSNVQNTESIQVTSYWRPSNTNETVVPDADGVFQDSAAYSINFDSEVDEWSLTESFNSLFEVFYKSYIKSVFDANKRVFKFKAYLPPSFLINYKLNDQLKVQDVVYRINSITTNLNTGLSRLELINLNVEEIVE